MADEPEIEEITETHPPMKKLRKENAAPPKKNDVQKEKKPKGPQPKKNPEIHVIYNEDYVPAHYEKVIVGNAFITRNVRKKTLEEGYDLYEYRVPSGYKNHTMLNSIYAPMSIVETVRQLEKASAEKRLRAQENAKAKERKEAWKSFDKLFPRMPEEERERVFLRAFAKRSGRIGHKKGFSMDSKIDLATCAYVKHEYATNVWGLLEDAKEELYNQTIGRLTEFDTRDTKDRAYEDFYYDKKELYEDFESQFDDQINQKIAEWK